MPLDRAQQEARKQFGRATAAELKMRCKARGWKFSQGWLFREKDGWFVDVRPAVWVMEPRSWLELFAKPMTIDPVFWDIVDAPGNRDMPLSFRLFGAWTVRTPAITRVDLPEIPEPGAMAEAFLDAAERELEAASPGFELEQFLRSVGSDGPIETSRQWMSALVCGLALVERRAEIRELCLSARGRREDGGYFVGSKSFVELTLDWLARTEPTRH